LRGRGISTAKGRKGDHYAIIRVTTPKDLTQEQEDLLGKFAKACGEDGKPDN